MEIQSYCIPNTITKTTTFAPNTLALTVNVTPFLESTFEPTWVTDPVVCILNYQFKILDPVPENPNLVLFDESQATKKVTVGT